MTAGNSQFHFASSTSTYLEPVVRPAAELHLAILVVEGEPGDVYGTRGKEDAGRNIGAQAVRRHHHVGRVCSVKSFARAEKMGDNTTFQ